MASDAIGAIARQLADVFVGSAVDASEEDLPRFGRRHPQALRFARLVGGAFLVLVGLYEAVGSLVVLVYVAYSGEGLWSLFLLLPLSMGVGLTIWGLGMMRRGWASRGVVDAALTDDDYSHGRRRTEGRLTESHNVEGQPLAGCGRYSALCFGSREA